LISDEAWADFLTKQERQEKMKQLLARTKVTNAMLDVIPRPGERSSVVGHQWPDQGGNGHVGTGASPEVMGQGSTISKSQSFGDLSSAVGQPLAQLLKRPEMTIERLAPVLHELAPEFFDRKNSADDRKPPADPGLLPSAIRNELKSVETEIKYAGYLEQQSRAIERLKKAEQRNIPEWFDYRSVSGLSREMQEKLTKVRPRTLGHASRIPGVTPAAVSLVNVYIEIQGKRREQATAHI